MVKGRVNYMAKAKTIQKHKKPPSRLRYEQSHPTVSFRLERSLHNELKEFLSQRGISAADFVKETLGVQQTAIKQAEEAWAEGYSQGFQKGKLEAKKELKIAMANEIAKVRDDKEQAIKEARDSGYQQGYERGKLDEKNESNKALSDRVAKLKAEKQEAIRMAREEGRKEGYLEGYKEAKDKYLVSCDCTLCGKSIEVVAEREKDMVREFTRQYHLAHGECAARENEKRRAEEAERLKKEAQKRERADKYGTRAVERGLT
jgi:flagellar biosynthesis/type III secretory pathway protein FliH